VISWSGESGRGLPSFIGGETTLEQGVTKDYETGGIPATQGTEGAKKRGGGGGDLKMMWLLGGTKKYDWEIRDLKGGTKIGGKRNRRPPNSDWKKKNSSGRSLARAGRRRNLGLWICAAWGKKAGPALPNQKNGGPKGRDNRHNQAAIGGRTRRPSEKSRGNTEEGGRRGGGSFQCSLGGDERGTVGNLFPGFHMGGWQT